MNCKNVKENEHTYMQELPAVVETLVDLVGVYGIHDETCKWPCLCRMCWRERDGMLRMTVNRTVLQSGSGDWEDGISWDDLQRLKREAGYGDRYAIEVYPADRDLVKVANMRHLWILQEPLPIGWFA